jgi:hypothetical protein
MKTKFTLTFLAAILIGLISCNLENDKYHIIKVRVEGTLRDSSLPDDEERSVVDYSRSVLFFYLSNEKGDIELPVSDNDLLIIGYYKSGPLIYYEYREQDGKELEFRIYDSIAFLNGKAIYVYDDGKPGSEHMINSMSDEEIRQLRYLYLYRNNANSDLSHLDRVAHINPHIGIIVEDQEIIMALDRFRPKLLIACPDSKMDPRVIEKISSAESIVSLVTSKVTNDDLDKILMLPNLRKLVVLCTENLDPSQELITNPTLEELYINGEDCESVKSLDFLGNLKNLKHLAVIGCDSNLDISALQGFTGLRTLNLIGENKVSGLSSLKDLHSLESFYFPDGTSQEDFNDFISDHQELKFISITGCESILDLTPLHNLKKLDFLTMSLPGSGFTAESLKGMEHLDYLSIGDIEPEDSTIMSEIRAVLPGTVISENTGVCLGSGYMLMVIPLFLLFSLILMVYRRRFA